MKNLIELAIRGCELNDIARNLGEMHIDMWQAERIINGLPAIDVDKIKERLAKENKEYISHEISNALMNDACVYVQYRYKKTVYWNKEYQMPEGVEAVDREEYSKMYRNTDYSSSPKDGYQYKMTFWETSSTSLTPESVAF